MHFTRAMKRSVLRAALLMAPCLLCASIPYMGWSTPAIAQTSTPASTVAPVAAPEDQPAAAAPAAPSPAPGAAVAVPAASAATPAPARAIDVGPVPHDLSIVGMFLGATGVVKAVIIGLVLASVVTWTIWISKTIELGAARRSMRNAVAAVSSAATLSDLDRTGNRIVDLLLAETRAELAQSAGLPAAGVNERIDARLQRLQARATRRALMGTNLLASIGSSAPFVGLFGTVVGIMNSFIGISRAQTTNLMVVAPGIAEALLATAFGLFAAIPAVIIYNGFARAMAGYRGLLGDAATYVACLAGRDLDRQAITPERCQMNAAE